MTTTYKYIYGYGINLADLAQSESFKNTKNPVDTIFTNMLSEITYPEHLDNQIDSVNTQISESDFNRPYAEWANDPDSFNIWIYYPAVMPYEANTYPKTELNDYLKDVIANMMWSEYSAEFADPKDYEIDEDTFVSHVKSLINDNLIQNINILLTNN